MQAMSATCEASRELAGAGSESGARDCGRRRRGRASTGPHEGRRDRLGQAGTRVLALARLAKARDHAHVGSDGVMTNTVRAVLQSKTATEEMELKVADRGLMSRIAEIKAQVSQIEERAFAHGRE